ncbi:MAG: YHYH protein [Bacteroidota bacterium]
MNRSILTSLLLSGSIAAVAQTNPAISAWLRNTTGITGRHYVSGNSTPITDAALSANVQTVQYSTNFVYVSTQGVPAYIVGPYLDGNPSQATNQNAIFKFPLNPVQNTGTLTNTSGGNIGVFINGAALFDYRDGVSWKNSSSTMQGGPLGGMGDGIWNRDAIVAEKGGFDCSKGHPAMGNYHHHQNPSAFNLDLTVISNVCNLYVSDGLYAIDSTVHSPLIGYAYDGFPIYGAYGYKNVNGTGGIVRMKSSYALRSITVRNTYASGASVTAGPNVSTTYPLGTFREDYQYNATSAATPDYLDEHNGRFCVTPEYPNGIYCYFATVDQHWNSYYPYVVGPTFYGTKVAAKVTSISETVTTYTGTAATGIADNALENTNVTVFPNPASDLVAIQINNLNKDNINVELYDVIGKLVQKTVIYQGSTIAYFDTRTLYSGTYIVKMIIGNTVLNKKIVIEK